MQEVDIYYKYPQLIRRQLIAAGVIDSLAGWALTVELPGAQKLWGIASLAGAALIHGIAQQTVALETPAATPETTLENQSLIC